MSWKTDLEIIRHHAITGGVWAGDQLDKVNLRTLRVGGYIRYDEAIGLYTLTDAGRATWSRWSGVYAAWDLLYRIKWRIRSAMIQKED